MADLGVALEQLGGEHDLVPKGGALELLLGGERLHGERRLLVLVTGGTPGRTDRTNRERDERDGRPSHTQPLGHGPSLALPPSCSWLSSAVLTTRVN
jgi:hypothetical protein